MARTDALVLGAGIVGTSIALHLAKRGLAVALVDRRGPGEDLLRQCRHHRRQHAIGASVSRGLSTLLRMRSARHRDGLCVSFCRGSPWLLAYRSQSALAHRMAFAETCGPCSPALPEHEALIAEAGAGAARKTGSRSIAATQALPTARARARGARPAASGAGSRWRACAGPALAPSSAVASFGQAGSISNPLAVTRAYAARFAALSGLVLKGDARSLHRNGAQWRIETPEGPVDAPAAVLALGPWTPDVLGPFGLRLPLAVKRGYHRHFRPRGNAGLTPGGRCRHRLLRRADGAGAAAHDRRRVCGARCAADAGAARSIAAGRACAVSAGRSSRGGALARQSAMLRRLAAGDWAGARAAGIMARLRPCPLGAHARSCHGAPRRRAAVRRGSVL